MNRSFKIQFHNGHEDEKTIVSMSVSVLNGKRYKDLDNAGKIALLECLVDFKKKVEGFCAEVSATLT